MSEIFFVTNRRNAISSVFFFLLYMYILKKNLTPKLRFKSFCFIRRIALGFMVLKTLYEKIIPPSNSLKWPIFGYFEALLSERDFTVFV